MGHRLHVLDNRALAFHAVAIDGGLLRAPVARLHVLDGEQATGNDTWPEGLKREALVVWHMGAVVDDDIKTPPGVLKKCAQESDVRLVAAVQIAPGVEVNSTVARTVCSVGCRLLSCMALGLEARLPVIKLAVADAEHVRARAEELLPRLHGPAQRRREFRYSQTTRHLNYLGTNYIGSLSRQP